MSLARPPGGVWHQFSYAPLAITVIVGLTTYPFVSQTSQDSSTPFYVTAVCPSLTGAVFIVLTLVPAVYETRARI